MNTRLGIAEYRPRLSHDFDNNRQCTVFPCWAMTNYLDLLAPVRFSFAGEPGRLLSIL